jgi:hypothetical protein
VGRPHEGNKSEDLPITVYVMLSGEKVLQMKILSPLFESFLSVSIRKFILITIT